MRAVVLQAGEVRLENDYPEPALRDGEVRVRVLEAGICETDLQLLAGYMDYHGVLGHEFVGVVETGRLAGQRVVGEINCPCGECSLCTGGLGNHCPKRSVLGILGRDGAFAQWLSLPEQNLHPVPDGLADRVAVFTEPVAAALQVPAQIPINGDERVVVLGAGRLGNLCAQVLHQAGCRVTVVGKHAAKLQLLEELGIRTILLEETQPGRDADLVVDATGSASGLPTALQFVRPRGTIALKTTIADQQTLSLAPVVIDEVTVVGSRCGPFDQALEALQSGKVDVTSLVSETVSLAEVPRALQRARADRELVKVVVEVSDR